VNISINFLAATWDEWLTGMEKIGQKRSIQVRIKHFSHLGWYRNLNKFLPIEFVALNKIPNL